MSKCKITGKVLIIQLGRDETQIALMGKGSEILHSAIVPTPVGAVEDGVIRNPDAVRGMLKTALKTPEFKHVRQAVFSLCTSQVIAETVTIPDLPVQKVEKLLQANVDTYFPVDMQDYQLVWEIIGPGSKESGLKELAVQLWAVPTAMIARYYNVANACGLSVAAIDYCGHSIATAVGASFSKPVKAARERKKLNLNAEITFGRKKQEAEPAASAVATETRYIPDTDLYLSLDSDLLGMTFVQDGQVVMQRFVQCGANPAFQFGELAMMVEYFRSLEAGRGSPISGIVSGSLALDKQLTEELADTLGLELALWDGGYEPRWTLCAGSARTTLDFGVPALNRPGNARRQVESQLWQYGLVLLSGAALVAVVLFTLSSRLTWNSSINSLESTKQTLMIQAQKSSGYADNYKTYSSLYDSYSADWETIFSSLRTYNDNLVLVLEELENTLPENSSVTNLQIAADGMTVQFACATKEEAAYLIMALRELRYADLTSISNLSGGGGGPATSYGPDHSDEEPPTEGSYELTTDDLDAVASVIAGAVDKDAAMELAMNLSPEQILLLAEAYGTQPETSYATLADLMAANEVTFEQRSSAANEMLTNNPFTMKKFAELLKQDWNSENVILINDFMRRCSSTGNWDIIEWMEDWISSGTVEDTDEALEYYKRAVDLIVNDPDLLADAEELFCTDPEMEQWYIYYLEVELGREKLVLPYLDVDKVVEDLLEGGFDTGDPELDEQLKGIISDDVWELIEEIKSRPNYTEEELTKLLSKYLTEGTTGSEALDAMIEKYLTTGTTGYDYLDDMIGNYLKSTAAKALMNDLLAKYLSEGTTGNATLDGMIDQYLATGSTGNATLDALIVDYLNSASGKAIINSLIAKYLSEGTTGNAQLDAMIEKYLTTGTTGNAALDALIKAYLDNLGGGGNPGDDNGKEDVFGGLTQDEIAELVNKYMTTGSTGVPALDALIEKYLTTGTTGIPELDAVIEDYLNSDAGKALIGSLVNRYLTTGTTGNNTLDALINKYISTGTTGNSVLDALIQKYLSDILVNGGTGGDDLSDIIDAILGGNTGNGTGTGTVTDTRIFFTVTLAYNDELKHAELERKGLSEAGKISKLEVSV